MRVALFLIAYIALACEDTLISPDRCGNACYGGETVELGVGACHVGTQICDATGRPLECVGEVLPAPEVCDGLDNDCNGEIDEGQLPSVGVWCGGPIALTGGPCRLGQLQCQAGELRCVGAAGPFPEICNGLDDDCDGEIDEMQLGGACYDGAALELVSGGICRSGIELCLRGEQRCEGQVLPVPEVCNGLDDDCDGVIDESDDHPFDIVILMDRSSSMVDDVPFIQPGLLGFIVQHLTAQYRYAIIDVPGPMDGRAAVLTDFVPGSDVLGLLDPIVLGNGGFEVFYDALFDVATGATGLSWRPDSKKIDLMFTDEEGQTARGLEQETVASALRDAQHTLYGFVAEPQWYQELADATGGAIFTSIADEGRISELVIFKESCK